MLVGSGEPQTQRDLESASCIIPSCIIPSCILPAGHDGLCDRRLMSEPVPVYDQIKLEIEPRSYTFPNKPAAPVQYLRYTYGEPMDDDPTWPRLASAALKLVVVWLIAGLACMLVAASLPYRSRLGDIGLGFGFGYLGAMLSYWWANR